MTKLIGDSSDGAQAIDSAIAQLSMTTLLSSGALKREVTAIPSWDCECYACALYVGCPCRGPVLREAAESDDDEECHVGHAASCSMRAS